MQELLGGGGHTTAPDPAQATSRRDALCAAAKELCARIERGDFDAGTERHALVTFLKRSVERRLAIVNPKLKLRG